MDVWRRRSSRREAARATASASPGDPAATACLACGASEPDADGRCSYCRSALPAAAPSAAAPSHEDALSARFAALRAHPAYAAAIAHPPAGPSVAMRWLPLGAFGVLFAVVSCSLRSGARDPVFDTPFFREHRRADPFEDAVPALFPVVGIALAAFAVYRMVRWSNAPRRAFGALFVARRTEVEGRRYGTTTTHHVTLESEHGLRREYACAPGASVLAGEDDLGVATVRDGEIVHFRRVPV